MASLKMCVLDVDYVIDDGKPVIRLWGKTHTGRSAAVLDYSFEPYFYAKPVKELSPQELDDLEKKIMRLENDGRKPLRIERVERKYLSVPLKFFRIFTQRPEDVPKIRDLLKDWKEIRDEFEYSIPFYRRYIIDRGLYPMTWVEAEGEKSSKQARADVVLKANSIKSLEMDKAPSMKVMAFDIETVDENEEPRVIMISLADSTGFEKVLTCKKASFPGTETLKDEASMINRFAELVRERDPDIIVGYNSDMFDFDVLSTRAGRLGIKIVMGRDENEMVSVRRARVSAARIPGRVHVDLYSFVYNIMQENLSTEVLSLDRVSQELIGKRKKEMTWKQIADDWKSGKDMKEVADYCLWDSKLTLMLSKSILLQIKELCRVTGQTMFDVSRMTYAQLVEWLLMRRAFDIGEISPNRPKYDEVMKRRRYPPYAGGYVHTPKEGLHEKIALFDFKSLYPSITITHNISPETLDCVCCRGKAAKESGRVPGSEHYYCRSKKGFIPEILENIVEARMDIKKKMRRARQGTYAYRSLDNRQNALKILANASYGYYAYAGSRWYSRVCAESITSYGRFYIKQVIERAEKMKFPVIYGDTDSLFIKVKTKKAAKDFMERVNRSLPGVMELDFEGFYRAGLFVLAKTGKAAKKRYALLDSDNRMTIRGFERVRRDWSNIAKDTQERVLMAILKDRSPEKAMKIVRETVGRLKSGDVKMENLVILSQITRPLDQYEQVGPHVAAAVKAMDRGRRIKTGSVISYIITKGTGTISQRAEPAEDAKNYDPDYYINNQVMPAAMRILSGLGFSEEEILSGKKESQQSLNSYIKLGK